mgnify:CR=1 FL=1
MAKKEKSKFKVETWLDHTPAEGEDFTDRVSLTVPNQTMSISEIVERFTRGAIDIPDGDLVFVEDSEIPDFMFMSRIDQMYYANELRRVIAQRRQALEEAESKKDAEGNPVKVDPKDYPKLTEPYEPPEVEKDD